MTEFTPVDINGVFDCRAYVPMGAARGTVPTNDYVLVITRTVIGEMKSGNGTALTVEFMVEGGEYNGHVYEEMFNLWHNSSPQTCDIAHQKLSSLCYTVGVPQVNMQNHARELLNSKCIGRLELEEDEYFDESGQKRERKQNRLKYFKTLDGRTATDIAANVPEAKQRTSTRKAAKKTAAAPAAPAQQQPQYQIEGTPYQQQPQQQPGQQPQQPQWNPAQQQQPQWNPPAQQQPQQQPGQQPQWNPAQQQPPQWNQQAQPGQPQPGQPTVAPNSPPWAR